MLFHLDEVLSEESAAIKKFVSYGDRLVELFEEVKICDGVFILLLAWF